MKNYKQSEVLKELAKYIVLIDGREREDYERYCDDHGLDPRDINGVASLITYEGS